METLSLFFSSLVWWQWVLIVLGTAGAVAAGIIIYMAIKVISTAIDTVLYLFNRLW